MKWKKEEKINSIERCFRVLVWIIIFVQTTNIQHTYWVNVGEVGHVGDNSNIFSNFHISPTFTLYYFSPNLRRKSCRLVWLGSAEFREIKVGERCFDEIFFYVLISYSDESDEKHVQTSLFWKTTYSFFFVYLILLNIYAWISEMNITLCVYVYKCCVNFALLCS
jgi:hypothetical protein